MAFVIVLIVFNGVVYVLFVKGGPVEVIVCVCLVFSKVSIIVDMLFSKVDK